MSEFIREAWRSVPSYEGIYKVSTLGRVVSERTGLLRKTHLDRYGYERIGLSKEGKTVFYSVHRIVAETFHELLPKKQIGQCQVNHRDRNKLNNAFYNLEWVTPKENMLHAKLTGTHNKERVKLSVEEAKVCRILATTTSMSYQELADYYKVSLSTIKSIVRGSGRFSVLKETEE